MTLRSRAGRPRAHRGAGQRRRNPQQAPVASGARSLYLYGFARLPVDPAIIQWPAGVGEVPGEVFLVPCHQAAAVVSEVSAETPPGSQVRGLRRDMTAHAEVLQRLAEVTAVLPVRFGVCVPDRHALLEEVLRPEYGRLDEQLSRVAGAVEVTLHVRYREQAILAEIGGEPTRGATGSRRRRTRGGFEDKLERGRRVVEAIQQRGRTESERLLQRLRPLAQQVQLAEPPSELTVLKAAFLVRRDQLKSFDRAVESLHEEMQPRTEFEYIGPLPPYSFTPARLAAA